MIWNRRWPGASLHDCVLMICGEWEEHGISRHRLARELKLPGAVLQRTLDRLVSQDWLSVEHPDGQPSRDSHYTRNEERPGYSQLRGLWFIDYGYVPEAGPLGRDRVEAPTPEVAEAARHSPDSLSEQSMRKVRSLYVEAARQAGRSVEVWDLMQAVYADGWAARERARDVIHLPPHHKETDLPSRAGIADDPPTSALALALACRKLAREDAWKFATLSATSGAGYARAAAMSQVVHGGTKALDSLRVAHELQRSEALRAGVRMAQAGTVLGRQGWAVDRPTVGFAGEVALAYSYRDMAQRLEGIVEEVLALPELAAAATSPRFREVLGAAPSYEVPEDPWAGGTYELDAKAALPVDGAEPPAVVELEGPGDLREGDVIVRAGDRDLTAGVLVVRTDAEGETVDLAVPESRTASEVAFSLLDYHGGLVVARGRESVASPLAE